MAKKPAKKAAAKKSPPKRANLVQKPVEAESALAAAIRRGEEPDPRATSLENIQLRKANFGF